MLILLVVRALLEAAIIFFAVAAVLLVFSFRLGRRLATTSPDRLERISARGAQLGTLIPRRPDLTGDDLSPAREQES